MRAARVCVCVARRSVCCFLLSVPWPATAPSCLQATHTRRPGPASPLPRNAAGWRPLQGGRAAGVAGGRRGRPHVQPEGGGAAQHAGRLLARDARQGVRCDRVVRVRARLAGRGRASAERRLAGHVGACRRVPQHPGGPLIYVAAGKDCTQLFDAYHPLRVRRVWSALWRAAHSWLRACARKTALCAPACAVACCPSTASAT